ncbi:cytochrome b561 [Candidatus Phycosocius bacilliformis]|uniref:Cytochrome b561 n=1 Tax=Candidatus Phycosocius bacilliformis TaxID=1445552 RepID=A0A2P2EEF3_9PROT|nr:cytochrome b [Candidatus Phycosocius bacilliformis]GBF59431.1 cytochrome b561 [Candidatus Phycosocius bacilliformis]
MTHETGAGTPSRQTYTLVAVVLHWVIAAAILMQILGGWAMEDLKGAEKFAAFQLHKSAGLTILLLSLLRLFWRLANPPPPLPETMKAWEVTAAKATHIALYALMIGIPLGGWVIISTSPYNIATHWWGLFEWPRLPLADLPFRKELNEMAKAGHSVAAWGVIVLFVIHVGAALKHMFINEDDVMARMLPFMRSE